MYYSHQPFRPEIGDVITRPKFPFTHIGVYVGGLFGGVDQVFTNVPGLNEHLTSFAIFAQNEPVSVVRSVQHNHAELYRRILSAINSGRIYNPFTNNCDHAVSRVEKALAESLQAFVWGAAAAVVVVAAVVNVLSEA